MADDRHEQIDVTVELHDRLSKPADKSGEKVKDLRDDVDELNTSLEENQAETTAASAATAKNTKATSSSSKATRDHTKATDDDTSSRRRNRDETDRQSKALGVLDKVLGRVGGRLKKSGKDGDAFGAMLKALKIPGLVTALTLAAQAISAVGAAGYAGVAGLAPLVGLLGVLPALVVGLGQAFGVVKMGFSGIGNAVKVLTDPTASAQKIADALEKLGPAARKFAIELAKVKEQTDGWKKSIQSAMLPGFAAGLVQVEKQFPTIRRGLVQTGTEMGTLGRRAGTMIGNWRDLGSIMDRNNRMIRVGLTPALLALLSIFHDLVVAGGPQAERFAKWVGQSATHLAAMVREGRQSGRLQAFFKRAGDLAAAVGRTLGNIVVGLFNIGRESGALSGMMGHNIEDLSAAFRRWTESTKGKASIRKYFTDAIPVVRQLGLLVGAIAKGLGSLAGQKSLAPLIKQIRTELLPAVETLAGGVSGGLGPALIDLATAFVQMESALSYKPFTTAVTLVASLAKNLTDLIATVPGLGTVIATLLTAKLAFKGLEVVGEKSGVGGLLRSMTSKTGGIRVFTQALRGNTEALVKNKTAETGAAKAGALAKTGWTNMVGGLKSAVKWIKASTVATEEASVAQRVLGVAIRFAMGPWGIAIAVIGVLITVFVLLYKHNEAFRNLVNKVAAAVVSFAKSALHWVVEVAKAVGGFFVSAWKAILPVVETVFHGIGAVVKVVIDAIVIYAKVLWFVYKTAFEIIAGIALLVFNHVILPAAKSLGAALAWIWKGIEKAAVAVWHVIAGAASWLWKVLVAGARIVWAGMKVIWRGIEKVANAVWKPIAAGAAWVWHRLEAGFRVVGGVVRTVWDDLKKGAVAAFDFVWKYVQPVVRNIGRIFAGLGRVIGGIWSGIKDGFSWAVNGIVSILNKIIGGINKLIDGINAVKLGADLPHIPYLSTGSAGGSQAVVGPTGSAGLTAQALKNAQARGLFAGGAPSIGALTLVGELGPELFVGRNGGIQLIGAGGPEFTRFAQPGYVVPNPATPSSVAKPVPSWVEDRLEGALPSAAAGPSSAGGVTVVDAAAPEITLQFLGDGSALTPAEVEAAALRAYRRWERERRERR